MTTKNLIPAVLGLVTGLILLIAPSGAGAFAAPHDSSLSYQRLSVDGDYFLNYDGGRDGRAATRDWPVTMVFWDEASVNRVKSFYDGQRGYNRRGGVIFEGYKRRVGSQYIAPRFDGDRGKKTQCDSAGQDSHFRAYGGITDRFSDPFYGEYVVATTHIDKGEEPDPTDPCHGEKYFGFSEDVEDALADLAKGSYTVREDHKKLYNKESLYLDTTGEDKHYWFNNGYATIVRMR
jgi:hypothetical protein